MSCGFVQIHKRKLHHLDLDEGGEVVFGAFRVESGAYGGFRVRLVELHALEDTRFDERVCEDAVEPALVFFRV